MRKLFVLVALIGMLVTGWPVAPAGAALISIEDPNTDGAVAAGDIVSVTGVNDHTVTVRLTVEAPENPTTDPNWTGAQSETYIVWPLDTDGDHDPEFDVEFLSLDGDLFGTVYEAGGEDTVCDGDAGFVDNGYQVSFPRECIGSPGILRFYAQLVYDTAPDDPTSVPQVDTAPNSGWSPNVAGPAPGADRQVRVGVVGRSDSALYVSGGFGGGFGFLGGQLLAAPALARIAPANVSDPADVLYVGTGLDNQLWARTAALGWRRLSSGGTFCRGGPGALIYTNESTQHLVVACRGGDDALWTATAPITPGSIPDLNNWARLGGVLSAGPAIGISHELEDKVTYLVRGTDGAIWLNTGTVGSFSVTNWLCKGHVAFNSLNDVSWFGCRGNDDALWVAKNTPSGWGPTTRLGGVLADGPGVAVTPERAVFFVQGTDNAVWQRMVSNSDSQPLTPFSSTGGQIKFGANAVSL